MDEEEQEAWYEEQAELDEMNREEEYNDGKSYSHDDKIKNPLLVFNCVIIKSSSIRIDFFKFPLYRTYASSFFHLFTSGFLKYASRIGSGSHSAFGKRDSLNIVTIS